jgi:26S proteasome regulatory subunit N13
MNQNLFAAAQQAQNQGPKPLLEFRAGKMNYDPKTKQVTADKRKGKVTLVVEDGLLHFQWRDREQNKLEDNLIIFPGDAKWTKIDKVTSGRVYLLDFVASSRQQFFWLQEPKTDLDEENSNKINEYLANGPHQSSINQQQQGLLNMLQQVSGGTSSRQQQTRQQVQIDQLQQIMQSINPSAARQQNQSAPNQQQQQGGQAKGPSLMQVLSTDAVCAAIQRHGDVFVRQLAEYLPEGSSSNVQSICAHVRSPQFQQMVQVFHNALVTGQLEGVMPSFGLNPIVGNPYYGGGV